MKQHNILLITICVLFILINPLDNFAQKTKPEEISNRCEDVPLHEKPRVTVGRFKVTNIKVQNRLGLELSTMLMNALNETNCFHVLESISNFDDLFDEIQLGQDSITTTSTAPQAGLMNGAQLIVSGEITEYDSDYVQAFGVGTHTAHVGFILKIVDPQTRTVVWSKSIDKKIVKPSVKVFGIDIATFTSKAMEDAVEESIFDAVELLLDQKALFENYNPTIHDPEPLKINEVKREIIISNIDFMTLSKIEKALKTQNTDLITKKSFKDTKGTIEVYFEGSTDDLATLLLSDALDVNLEVTGFEDLKIEAKVVE